ncbi:MAG: hypothetical protein ABSB25_00855 [Sedimentisphaerales bacterium]|jgi:hypothetical protein
MPLCFWHPLWEGAAEEIKAWRTNLIWSTGLVDYALRLTKPAESAQSASKINPPANRIVANKFIE